MPRHATTPFAFLPLPLLVLISLVTLATISSALPTSFTPRAERGPAVFEPLFRRAAEDVGPRRSLERLRLRRNAVPLVRRQEPITNPKARRSLTTPVVAVIANPKATSALPSPVVGVVALNPKAKRSVPEASLQRKPRRSLLSVFSTFFSSVKARRTVVPLETPTALAVVQNPKAARALLDRRAQLQIGVVLVYIPNPKSSKFAAASSSAAAAAAKTSTSKLTSTSKSSSSKVSSHVSSTKASSTSKSTQKVSTSTTAKKTSSSTITTMAKSTSTVAKSTSVKTTAKASSTHTSSKASSTKKVASTTSSKPASTSTHKVSTSTTAKKTSSTTTKAKSTTTTSKATSVKTTAKTSSTTKKVSSTKVSTTSKVAATPSASSWPAGDLISAAYYPDWDGDLIPPSQVDFSLFDLIDFAFAVPTSNYGVEFTQDDSAKLLEELVKYAHGNNTKVLISIGGWTDSTYFSDAVSTATNRALFVKNIVAMATAYKVDGIDIDWEYPGGGGADGNEQSTKDTANFLLFLTALRKALGPTKRISACTTEDTFTGADGNPLSDVSTFAAVLDNILVMNYDVWGASSTPGPNAPLSDACTNSQQPNANELSAIETWTAAGMPASKILMGVPSYGYISSSTATTLVHKRALGGVSNRERATLLRKEKRKSVGRRSFELGGARRAKRQAEAEKEKVAMRKRGTIIVCPNNHSGNPCAGIVNQTIKGIDWNPLNTTTNANGTVSGGVFGGGVGIGKLGNGNLAAIDGNQIQFYQLLSYGVIVEEGKTGTYVGTNGYTRKWDSCSNTPYLYDVARKVVITYDDPESMTLKAQMAKKYKISGINMWDISGDTATWSLVNAYRSGMGLK